MRGKGVINPDNYNEAGIIPAGAGKRPSSSMRPPSRRDHPRGCGEKSGGAEEARHDRGSSPRVRGKAPSVLLAVTSAGIIPAGAGKREWWIGGGALRGDHPRGCGEKGDHVVAKVGVEGSSPRVRGKGVLRGLGRRRARIIPAGAGKSSPGRSVGSARRDHPRGCGEKARKFFQAIRGKGSSPRVRGKDSNA